MKKTLKIAALALSLTALVSGVFGFASCKTGNNTKKEIVTVMKYGDFGSLNDCEEGILKGLSENGITEDKYTIELVDSNFSMETATSQAAAAVNKGSSIILSIATPCAVAAANASNGTVPVVYCAVTDDNNMNNFKNVCGTSDIPDYELTLEMVTKVMGKENLKIGVLRYVDESSDAVMVDEMKKAAAAYEGMVIQDTTINDMTLLTATVDNMTNNVDCIVNILDSTIVGKLDDILAHSTVPVFGSEIDQVKDGCIAAVSYDYVEQIGKEAGRMAAQILKGEKKASELGKLRFIVPDYTPSMYCNAETLAKFGMTAPATVKNIEMKTVNNAK